MNYPLYKEELEGKDGLLNLVRHSFKDKAGKLSRGLIVNLETFGLDTINYEHTLVRYGTPYRQMQSMQWLISLDLGYKPVYQIEDLITNLAILTYSLDRKQQPINVFVGLRSIKVIRAPESKVLALAKYLKDSKKWFRLFRMNQELWDTIGFNSYERYLQNIDSKTKVAIDTYLALCSTNEQKHR